jgi:hypothetical protein
MVRIYDHERQAIDERVKASGRNEADYHRVLHGFEPERPPTEGKKGARKP